MHELTAHAFDALLKTLEEPPPHVIFILATTEAERVQATITSRCQRYDFRRIRLPDVVSRLAQVCDGESVRLPPGAPGAHRPKGDGLLRDAVNLLEQVVAAHGAQPLLSEVREALGAGGDDFAATIVRHALAGELAPAFGAIAKARDEGIEPRQLQRAASERLRCILLLKAGAEHEPRAWRRSPYGAQVEAHGCDITACSTFSGSSPRLISEAMRFRPCHWSSRWRRRFFSQSRRTRTLPRLILRRAFSPSGPIFDLYQQRARHRRCVSPHRRRLAGGRPNHLRDGRTSGMRVATPIALLPPAVSVANEMEQMPPPATWAEDGFGDVLTVGRLRGTHGLGV